MLYYQLMEGFDKLIQALIKTEGAKQLALRLGVSRAAIYLYAKGQTPSIRVVEKIGGTIQFPKTAAFAENKYPK